MVAAARAKAEKQQRVRASQNVYNTARAELNDLISKRGNLNKAMRQDSIMKRLRMVDNLLSLNAEIQRAENNAATLITL